MSFLWKRSQILLPGADHGLKIQVKKDIQQLAHASIFTRLILILMRSLYSYIFGFYKIIFEDKVI